MQIRSRLGGKPCCPIRLVGCAVQSIMIRVSVALLGLLCRCTRAESKQVPGVLAQHVSMPGALLRRYAAPHLSVTMVR